MPHLSKCGASHITEFSSFMQKSLSTKGGRYLQGNSIQHRFNTRMGGMAKVQQFGDNNEKSNADMADRKELYIDQRRNIDGKSVKEN